MAPDRCAGVRGCGDAEVRRWGMPVVERDAASFVVCVFMVVTRARGALTR